MYGNIRTYMFTYNYYNSNTIVYYIIILNHIYLRYTLYRVNTQENTKAKLD